jgi:hypothetical protein
METSSMWLRNYTKLVVSAPVAVIIVAIVMTGILMFERWMQHYRRSIHNMDFSGRTVAHSRNYVTASDAGLGGQLCQGARSALSS